MKLISMVDFVLQQVKYKEPIPYENVVKTCLNERLKIKAYANFLNQPLTLGMFVPCDLDGNVLRELDIINYEKIHHVNRGYKEYSEKYQQAKERVLFEGKHKTTEQYLITSNGSKIYRSNLRYNTIESTARRLDLTLTPNAVKQLGL